MRLWHYKLIEYLPNTQLIAQWRELNSIFKKQDRHILINYIYDCPIHDLYAYSLMVICQMSLRGIKIRNYDNFNNYFIGIGLKNMRHLEWYTPFENYHNKRYLLQCFYNLQEKYDRGQKDFDKDRYEKLEEFVQKEMQKYESKSLFR